jgi:hypothetical protein
MYAAALPIASSMVPYTNTQDTTGATIEAGEPSPCADIGLDHTVWYSFSPQVTGIYQIDLSGSTYDTAVAVYSDPGSGIGALVPLECNDDTVGVSVISHIKFQANSGATYAIQVGGFNASSGTARFNLAPAIGRTDPVGDAVDFGVGHPRLDITEVTVAHDSNDILIRMELATGTHAPSSGNPYATVGYIDIDVDRSAGTGTAPKRNCCGLPPASVTMGDEYFVDLFTEASSPGLANVIETSGLTVVGSASVAYTPASITVAVPRDLVGYPAGLFNASVDVAAIVGTPATATDGWPNADPVGTSCTAPWNEDSQDDCFVMSGLWHKEGLASISGMSENMLAYNFGCTGAGTGGCSYDNAAPNSGLAASPSFGPIPATGGALRFKTARATESGAFCSFTYDQTIVMYSTSQGAAYAPLPLIAASITAGGQMFAETIGGPAGAICGDDLTAQVVTAPLPAGTTNVAFRFDTVDALSNAFAGQFIDEVQICTNPDVLLADGCLDNCPGVSNPGQADNDDEFHINSGSRWVPDGLPPEGSNSGGDACDINDDNDLMCTDVEEAGGNINLGGTRNSLSIWDFGDVPVPARADGAGANGVRNGAVTLADVGATLFYVGAVNDRGPNAGGVDYDSDKGMWTDTMPANGAVDPGEIQAGNGVEDGAEYDRTPAGEPPGALSGPPNGAVSLQDVGVVLSQVGHSCAAAPN